MHSCMYVNIVVAPAHARTRAHRPAAPRKSPGMSQTPRDVADTTIPHGLSTDRHSTQTAHRWEGIQVIISVNVQEALLWAFSSI